MTYILFGASNPETLRQIKASGIDVAGFLDNDAAKHWTRFCGYQVLGGMDLVPDLLDCMFVNLITRTTRIRHDITAEIKQRGGRMGNLIHPSVNLDGVRYGQGEYIQDGVVIQQDCTIGDNCSIHVGSMIGHETKVGESCFIAHMVAICGCVTIGDRVFIGSNATILPRLKIGNDVMIGAGSVVTKDIPDGVTVVGNPARIIE